MAKPKPTHPIACFLLRLIVRCKRGAQYLCPNLWFQHVLGIFGFLTHLVPWLVIRIVTLWIIVPGDFSPALNRLLWSLPVYGFWYGFSTYWVRDYCMLWVTVAWLVLLPLTGLLALGHTQLRQRLRVRYQLPALLSASFGVLSLLVISLCVAGLIRVSPLEFLRGNAPDFSTLTRPELDERLSSDEHQLAVILDGLTRLDPEANAKAAATPEVTSDSPEATSAADVSQQRQAVVLRYHTALRRLAWRYQNHARLSLAPERQRAEAVHLRASATAQDLTSRWYLLLDEAAKATMLGTLAPREPHHGEALLTREWAEKLRPFLQPGDILITRSNGYRATGQLPGSWSQLALYVGTTEQLQQAGLNQDMRVQRHLETFAAPDSSGHRAAVVHVDGNGVGFSSLERTISEADSVAVLRPKLRPIQRMEMVSRVFEHVGKPYDYDFDFAHADKLLCSELVARALQGFVDFPLETIAGRPVLTGDGLVAFWATGEGGTLLEFVAYVNGDEATGECNWGSPGDLVVGRATQGNGELQIGYDAPLKP